MVITHVLENQGYQTDRVAQPAYISKHDILMYSSSFTEWQKHHGSSSFNPKHVINMNLYLWQWFSEETTRTSQNQDPGSTQTKLQW